MMNFDNLSELLEESVHRAPDSTVFIYKGRAWTFQQLHSEVLRCSVGLLRQGIKKGDTFGIVCRNCPEFVVLFFALARIGASAVPVNFLEKAERIALIFQDAGIKGCLTSREFLAKIQHVKSVVLSLKHIFLRDEGAERPFRELLVCEGTPPEPLGGANDTAMLIYTAGTTGQPKGVMLTHKNLCANVESCIKAIDIKPSDRFFCLLPMFHSFAWTVCVLIPIRVGCMTVIWDTLQPFEPVLKAIWEHKVTCFVGVPPLFAAMAQKIRGIRAFVLRFLNPVRLAVSGAASLPADVLWKFESAFGVPLLEGYGLTEASPVVSINPLHDRRAGTVGKPLPGVQVKTVDDDGSSLPPGQVGEICVKGDNVMAGYHNHPEDTASAFTPDGWLKTGDLGFLDNAGYLTISDRKKDLIIAKGFNVYPHEVEAVINQHPAVNESAVVGIPDRTGDEIVLAYVALKEGAAATAPVLIAWCRERLAPYKVPRHVEFREELPKNTLGKILRKDLRSERLSG